MATISKFNCFVADLAHKKHDFSSDAIKMLLSTVAPVATNTVKSNITEIATGGGYTAGGTLLTTISSSQTGGNYKFIVSDYVWTGTGAGFTFQYITFFNDTATTDPLIAWIDQGSPVVVTSGATFTLEADALNGLFQLT